MSVTPLTEDEFAAHLATQVDALCSLAGAGNIYRKKLEEQGFDPHFAQGLAAAWIANVQERLI